MHSLAKPQWLLLLNTAPVILLGLLSASTYSLVHTLLPPASLAMWHGAGWVLAALAAGTLLAAGWA